jgi:hypothetical protein
VRAGENIESFREGELPAETFVGPPRGDGGVYRFGWKKGPGIKAKGSLINY